MRGITGYGAYLPYRRLDLQEVAGVAGGGGRKGQRTVASFDEDATTMAVEAARAARRLVPDATSIAVVRTVAPPYLDRTNATTIHAALRLPRTAALRRGGFGAERLRRAAAPRSIRGPALAVASDLRSGLPGGPDEAYFGDGAAGLIFGGETDGPVVAEIGAWVSVSEEFLDRWRAPGDVRSKVWEERFGEEHYTVAGNRR